jgi:hypothetical protein
VTLPTAIWKWVKPIGAFFLKPLTYPSEDVRQGDIQETNFWLKAVPVWFDWLKYLMILSALAYAYEKTKSEIVFYVYVVSSGFLITYFNHFFISKGVLLRRKWPLILELGLLGIAIWMFYFVTFGFVGLLTEK